MLNEIYGVYNPRSIKIKNIERLFLQLLPSNIFKVMPTFDDEKKYMDLVSLNKVTARNENNNITSGSIGTVFL